MEASPLWFVTQFLSPSDMCKLEMTCRYMKQDNDIWHYFFGFYKGRLTEYESFHLDQLSAVFYKDSKRAVKSYVMYKKLYLMSFQDQVYYLSRRRNILLYLIGLWQRFGKECLVQVNKRSNQQGTLPWKVSCWTMLKGKDTRFFRRNYLPVY
jgi:hypothetical protein